MDCIVEISAHSDFPLENLPYGVFSDAKNPVPRPGVALGEYIVDLTCLEQRGLFAGPHMTNRKCFQQGESLNTFMGFGVEVWAEARKTLTRLLSRSEGVLRDDSSLMTEVMRPMKEATMHLPASIGDFTDFFACKTHAETVGGIFRSKENPLTPNWVHMPVGYHGRSSSIILSGTDFSRPKGQFVKEGESEPSHGPTEKLDIELEMGVFIGGGNELGKPIGVDEAWKYMFGLVLLNDWSLRDIQKWESQPLGPLNSKNCATTISPWIVTMEALEPFKCDLGKQDRQPLPYLAQSKPQIYDINLEVYLKPQAHPEPFLVSRSNLTNLYWSVDQIIAHHTVSGCNFGPGDLIGTGTLSPADKTTAGCFLEMTLNGTQPKTFTNPSGQSIVRSYVEDNDEITFRGWCSKEGAKRIGFGECIGSIKPTQLFT